MRLFATRSAMLKMPLLRVFRNNIFHLAALGAISALAAALYFPYLHNPWIFDDHSLFTSLTVYDFAQQPFSLSPRTFPYFTLGFTQVLFNSILAQRVVSLVLHILVAWTIYFWCQGLLIHVFANNSEEASKTQQQVTVAALAAACIFVVHPAAVYGAGYLAQRTIVLATLFSLLSLGFLHRCLIQQRLTDAITAALFFGLAVFSKEHSVPLFLVGVLLIAYCHPPAKFALRAGALYLAFCIPIALIAVTSKKQVIGNAYEAYAGAVLSQIDGIPLAASAIGKWLASAVTQMGLFFKYQQMWLQPDATAMSIDMRVDFAADWSPFWIATKVIAYGSIPIAAGLLLLRSNSHRRSRLIGFALGMAWIMFSLELGTARFQEPFVLYRSYLWAPAVMLVLALLLSNFSISAISAVSLVSLVWLFPQAQGRLTSMQSELAVWEDAAVKLLRPDIPGADRIYYNRGNEYGKHGKYELAISDFDRVVALNPTAAQGYLGRGTVLARTEHYQEALTAYESALLKSDNPAFLGFVQYQRAIVLTKLQRLEEAQRAFQASADYDFYFAKLYLKSNAMNEAEKASQKLEVKSKSN